MTYSRIPHRAGLLLLVLLALQAGIAHAQLNENCTISILNRTARVRPDGSWRIDNVPANFGRVRARATCAEDDVTRTGQSAFFTIQQNTITGFNADISLTAVDPVPTSLTITATTTALTTAGASTQLTVTTALPDGKTRDVTAASGGTSYTTSNRAVATVSADGLVTAVAGGSVIVSALNEGALGLIRIQVTLKGGDTDRDGIPDDVELANGLDPNDPADGAQDADGDGLTNKQELVDFNTNPRVADTDGDGVRDGLEVQTGSNPLDPTSVNLGQALTSLAISPANSVLILNTIIGEASRQLTVTGYLHDGTTLDLTQTKGTSYSSASVTICTVGPQAGRVFAGTDGACTVTATNSGLTATASVTVRTFAPIALSSIPIPGYANNVDVSGHYAYVAAGATGLQIVDVTDPRAPVIVGARDTPGNANDVRVVGNFAYIADGTAGLQILDISTPTAPVIVGVVDTPGEAQDVMVSGARAYVADGGAGLQIIDVSTPTAPRLLGTVDTPGIANGVDVTGDLAVVADGAFSSIPAALRVIDLAHPAGPRIVGSVRLSAEASDVRVRDPFAYVSVTIEGLQVVDISVPTLPRIISSLPNDFVPLDGELLGPFAFFADKLFPNAVPIVDVSDPAGSIFRAILDFSPLGDAAGTGIAVTPQFIYMTGDISPRPSINGTTGNTRLFIGQYLTFPEDTAGIPPTVQITSPSPGTAVTEGAALPVTVESTDDVAVAAVDLLLNGQIAATGLEKFIARVPLGSSSLTLSARATDAGGNVGVAPDVVLQVLPEPPPTVSITSPVPGAVLIEGDKVTMTVVATDDTAVTAVNLLVDGVTISTVPTEPYQSTFIAPVGVATLTLGATARDALGKVGETASVVVHVIPDPHTTATGRVLDQVGNPIAGAQVTCLELTANTSSDGLFILPGLPTIRGDVLCTVSFVLPVGVTVRGRTALMPPVRGGTVDMGQVALPFGGPGPLYPGQKFAAGDAPLALAVADLNGDGAEDVLVVNDTTHDLSLLFGYGDGTLRPQQRLSAGINPSAVAVEDVNNDGSLDLLVAQDLFSGSKGSVTVLLGAGEGTFQPPQSFGAGTRPSAVAAADLNGDSLLDIIVANQDSNDVSVLLGNGNGTFRTEQRFAVGSSPKAVAVGDLNGDRRPDVVTANTNTDDVSVLLSNGDGTFAPQQRLLVGDNPRAVAVADLNGDGRLDLVTANANTDDVSVLLGNGNGTFTAQQRFAVGDFPSAVTVAHVNGDGVPDLVVTNSGVTDEVSVLIGNGDGTFQPQRRTLTGSAPVGVAVGDFDFDGELDVATANSVSDDVSVLHGLGDGTFESRRSITVTTSTPRSVAAADLNRDGLLDLAIGSEGASVFVLLGTGGGNFGPQRAFSASGSPTAIIVADLNRDGILDLIAGRTSTCGVSVLLGNGNGTFQTEKRLSLGGGCPAAVVAADFNGNGILDLATANTITNDAAVLLGNGDGTFSAPQRFPAGAVPAALAAGDLNGDGKIDLVVAITNSDDLSLLVGNGNGTFQPQQRFAVGDGPLAVAVADMNADGRLDIITGNGNSDDVSLLFGNGDSTFAPQQRLPAGDRPDAVTVADVNADGIRDIVIVNENSQDVSVFIGTGAGTFAPQQRFAVGNDPRAVTVGDLDLDGATDLVTADRNSRGVSILLQR